MRGAFFGLATALSIALDPAVAISDAPAADRVAIGDAFAIDRTEVTIGRFRAFLDAAGADTAAVREGGGFEYALGWTRRPGWSWAAPYGRSGADEEPAVHVSWSEARDFCRAAGGRLPTFEEWRRAAYTEARAAPTDGFETGRTYPYPVGDDPDGMNNSREAHVLVGTTRRGVNGLYDMGANVWEWMADRRGDDALTAGGSWWYGPEKARAAGAQWKPADFYAVYIGFRCVYDLD
ncbi:MAG: formylglycine-generating enzyme family protein [Pseudomonadota bacterium]